MIENRWLPAPPPSNDAERLAALASYEILDTEHEKEFDDIVSMAAELCDVPISVINLIADGRQWFKSEIGLNVRELPLDISICAHALLQKDVFVIEDMTEDETFRLNPIVTNEPHIRFYAGALLNTPDGYSLGTLCVLDTKPRKFSARQKTILSSLARLVMTQLDLRRTIREKERADERLRIALEASRLGTWDIDVLTGELVWSQRCRQLFGLGSDETPTLENFINWVHADDRAPVRAAVERSLADGSHYDVFFRIQRIPGRWIRALGEAIFDNGKPIRFAGTVEDISERKTTEIALRNADAETYQVRKTYETLLSGMTDFAFVLNPEGRFIFANNSLLRLWGKTADEARNKNFLELGYPAEVAERHFAELAQVRATGRPFRGEIPFAGKDGIRIYDYIFEPVFDEENNRIVAFTGTTRDVTERKEMEEQFRIGQERLMLALEASELIGTWDWNIKQNIVIADARFKALFGVTTDDALTGSPIEPFLKAIHADDIARVQDAIADSLKTGAPYNQDYRLVQPDGAIKWVKTRGRVYYDDDGAPARLPGVAIDITAAREATEKLREINDFLGLILENAIDFAIISMDTSGNVTSWSPGAEAIFGFPAAEAIGRHASLIFTPEDRAAHVPEVELGTALANGIANDERWHIRRDGTRFYANGVVRTMIDQYGVVRGFLKIARDMTVQKRSEEILIEARNAAEAANIAKTEFLANMSHEIRTPMNAVIGLSNILSMSSPLTQQQRDYIRTLQMSADSLLDLINDLLDISKIEARTVELEKIPFSITQIVQETISMMAVRSQEKNLELIFRGECVEHRMFVGDPTRLRQIIVNLCSNAVKFTDQGSITISVDCSDAHLPGYENIAISVLDTGIGIPADKVETIFQKFVQADTSISRKYGGTGLGLAITKTLIDIMGGDIKVESTLGRGSCFTVTIPLPRAENSDIVAGDPLLRNLGATASAASRRKILLVEDYAPNVLVARAFLEEFGYQCDVASNGLEAIDLVKSNIYGLALMDVQMHGMNGLDTTMLIRAREAKEGLSRLPIIGMTAHALAGDRERCLASGMDDYLSKPFDPEALRIKIAAMIAPLAEAAKITEATGTAETAV